jgi:RHS repeat-associated protein
VIAYRYDAVGRRVESVRSQYDANGVETTSTTRFYYDGQNVIAEYAYTPAAGAASATETLVRTYVNGTQYIDERVVMRNHTGTGDYRGDHYYLHEELYSVAGLARPNGSLEEAYVYDTYGQARIYQWREGDFGRNGVIGDTDDAVDTDYLLAHLSGSGVATPEPFLDLDGDGDADGDDVDEFMDNNGQEWLAPVELASSEVGNPYLFTGRPTDTLGSLTYAGATEYKRIQDNRNRVYDPKHGRWMQRDLRGLMPGPYESRVRVESQYGDGSSLYLYALGSPTLYFDPQGLWSIFDAARSAGRILAAGAAGAAAGAVTGGLTGFTIGVLSPPLNPAAGVAGFTSGVVAGATVGAISAATGQAATELLAALSDGVSELEFRQTIKDALAAGAVAGPTAGAGGAISVVAKNSTAKAATLVTVQTGVSATSNFVVTWVVTGDTWRATLHGAFSIPFTIGSGLSSLAEEELQAWVISVDAVFIGGCSDYVLFEEGRP